MCSRICVRFWEARGDIIRELVVYITTRGLIVIYITLLEAFRNNYNEKCKKFRIYLKILGAPRTNENTTADSASAIKIGKNIRRVFRFVFSSTALCRLLRKRKKWEKKWN